MSVKATKIEPNGLRKITLTFAMNDITEITAVKHRPHNCTAMYHVTGVNSKGEAIDLSPNYFDLLDCISGLPDDIVNNMPFADYVATSEFLGG